VLDKISDDFPSLIGLLIAISVTGISFSVVAILIIRGLFSESWTPESKNEEDKISN